MNAEAKHQTINDGGIDRTMPDGKWQFGEEETRVFDDMLTRSIPQYSVMREACFDVACSFVRKGTDIVDLGCSRGEAIYELLQKFQTENQFVGVEISQPMLAALRRRFAPWINCGTVRICEMDLRGDFPPCRASVIQSVLTLQFTPTNYRPAILQRVYDHLLPGGAFILVEKLLGGSARINELMVDTYHALKAEHGYSQDQIERKQLALEGVLVPVDAHTNEHWLERTGFKQFDCFWRWMTFAAWVAGASSSNTRGPSPGGDRRRARVSNPAPNRMI